MSNELRVRLEGAWETLQSTSETFERAARSLSRGQTDHVARAVSLRDSPDTQHARDAVERVADEAPEAAELLERYRTARGAFVEALQSRASALGLEGPTDQSLVKTLETDVLWEGRAVNWSGFAIFVLVGAVMTGLAFQSQRGVWWFPPLCVVAVIIAGVFSAPKMRVTKQTVVVGYQSFRVDELRACRVKRVERSTGKGGRSIDTFLEFELEHERLERIKVPTIPDGFYTAMNSLGLPPVSA